MHWAESYVGLPYSQFDCAQLCVKVQLEQFSKKISMPEDRPKGVHGLSYMIGDLQKDIATKTSEPKEGDAALMIGRGRLNHIGIVCFINEQIFILHAMRNAGITVLHNIISLDNIGLKLEGYYKWK